MSLSPYIIIHDKCLTDDGCNIVIDDYTYFELSSENCNNHTSYETERHFGQICRVLFNELAL